MSADLLNEASDRIRGLAAAATQGKWSAEPRRDMSVWLEEPHPYGSDYRIADCMDSDEDNVPHIAAWQPDVAREVADLLDVIARDVGTSSTAYHAALKVARTFLGRQS